MKTQDERLQECIRLREQWQDQVKGPVPDSLVNRMNDFVRDGTPASGAEQYFGKTLFYQLSTKAETYISIRSPRS